MFPVISHTNSENQKKQGGIAKTRGGGKVYENRKRVVAAPGFM
jgi:hypothetical protein